MAGFLPRLFSQALPRAKPYQEMGVSGTPVYAGYVVTAERNARLIGQEKYRTYSDILVNTSIVAAATRYFLNVIARPGWSCEPADDSDEAKRYAEFVEHVLLEGIHTPWSRVIRRAGTYRFHGFHISEWTAMRLKDDKKYPGKIGFRDIEARPQWTIWRWEVDERGTVVGAWQRDPLTGNELGLPRTKIMYVVDDTLTDNPEGMGLLRHCVEPAERLKEYLEQEGIGFLRDLRGIPVGRAPMDELANAVAAGAITQAQMDQALNGLKDFVTLEKKTRNTSIIVNSAPYVSKTDTGLMVANSKKWDVELINSRGVSLAEAGKAIDRLTYELARILSCEHLLLGSTSSGSYSLAKEKSTDLYLMANSVLRDIRLQAQHDLINPLWSLNGFPDEMKPKLKSEDVAPKDVEQISAVLQQMAQAGAVLPPDDEAINFVRDLLGAPQLDLHKYMQQMMSNDAPQGNTKPQPGANNKPPAAQAKPAKGSPEDNSQFGTSSALDTGATKAAPSLRLIRKVLGDTVADYIHDFVNSDNPKFRGKSKAERTQMALGAFYSKAQSGTADGYEDADNEFDVRTDIPRKQGPSQRSVSTGRGIDPGSHTLAKYNDDGNREFVIKTADGEHFVVEAEYTPDA